MGPDAAIGDDHGAAVGEQRDVVRLHAMRVELRDLLITASGVTNANHTPRVVVVIFRCVENFPVGRENAMTGEMPVGPRLKPSGLAIVERHRDAEFAGMARERDPFTTVGTKRDVMAAAGQHHRFHVAVETEQGRGEIAAVVFACRGKECRFRRGAKICGKRDERCGAGEAGDQLAAVELHQSPSMALKPKLSPAFFEIMSEAVWAAPFSETRKASSLARISSLCSASAIGASIPRSTSMA